MGKIDRTVRYRRARTEREGEALIFIFTNYRHAVMYIDAEKIEDWHIPSSKDDVAIAHHFRPILRAKAIRFLRLIRLDLNDYDARFKLYDYFGAQYFKKVKIPYCKKGDPIQWTFTAPDSLDPDYFYGLLELCPPDNTNTIKDVKSNDDDTKHERREKDDRNPNILVVNRYPGEQVGDAVFHFTGYDRTVRRNVGVTIDLGKYIDPPLHPVDTNAPAYGHIIHDPKIMSVGDGQIDIAFGVPRSFKRTSWHYPGFDRDFVDSRGGARGRRWKMKGGSARPAAPRRASKHYYTEAQKEQFAKDEAEMKEELDKLHAFNIEMKRLVSNTPDDK